VKDTNVNEHSGNFTDWHLKLWGESIDAKKATLLPMPTEEDDNDHDKIATTTLPATTTTLPPTSSTPQSVPPLSTPSDHPDRPVKPTATPAEQGSPAGTTSPAASETSNSSWLPSFLKNVSSAGRVWIYGALGLIVAFVAGLGVYLWMARRRRLRNNPRDTYEFELIDEEEAEGLNSGEKGRGGSGRKKRGGELYDAFAGGSDDEVDDGDDFADAQGYRDRAVDDDEDGGRNEKGRRDLSEEAEHHVIGDDSDDSDGDDGPQDSRLLSRRS